MEFEIRYSELADLLYLQKWLSMPNGCDPFPFNGEEKEMALNNWIGFSKYKASLTATVENTPCAIGTLFLMPYRKVAHHCPFYLVVDPQFRQKGIGSSMVKNLVHLAKTRFRLENVLAEVYGDNPISSILAKSGFTQFVEQGDFVHLDGKELPRALWEATC